MGNGFEEQAYEAACMAMGAAVWQLVAAREILTPDNIASMVLDLSERYDDLATSIALSILLQA
ncbi:hypothetical protein [Pantoea agglomerans]|uniref:hypothetical protein n=1 Tax=Enterobacter agglomerans TaxID=549 RepID=UPI003BF50204